jgi:EAL domain-containing protein (putative c-di-GMP-specific phosphodiesterase class I)
MSSLLSSGSKPNSTGRVAYILDDEPRVRWIVGKILASIDFETREFASPAALFADLKTTAPEVIVMGLRLGHTDAVDVIRHLELFRYKGQLLLMGGDDQATLGEIQHIGERHGLRMLPPVQKPFRVADIRSSIDAIAWAHNEPPPGNRRFPEQKEPKEIRIDQAEALRNGWLRLWYQAKIDLKSMTVCGAEALLRISHPNFGIISPTNFFPAGGSAIYQPLTKFVVQQAMADWENFAAQGQPLRLSINVTLSILNSPTFVDLIRKSLPKKPSFPGLTIEVSECDMLLDPGGIGEIGTQLRLYNVVLSIDDFGGPHSSLAGLLDLPCVELKLGRRYVSGCATDGAKQSVCAAAIELAHGFGLTVCAMGVENVQDLRTLIDLGCHSAQGFLFARPTDSVSFVKMLLGVASGSTTQSNSAAKRQA